jgi:zinc-ribbon domain
MVEVLILMALVKCPDCGRDVSDSAPACPNCGRPNPGAAAPPRSGILASNLSAIEAKEEAPKKTRGGSPLPFVLSAVLLAVLGAGAALLVLTATQQRGSPAAARPTPAAAPASASGGAGILPDINGISCDALESTIVHLHVHLAIFVNGEEQQVPFGIGIGQPWQVTDSDEGPFVTDGACFYWIHTHTEDGIVHIESPVRRRFTLGDFFAIWQVPLSGTQVGNAQGQVITYVNGQRNNTNPPDIPLLPHARIQLCVGGDVPPQPFDFPPGD